MKRSCFCVILSLLLLCCSLSGCFAGFGNGADSSKEESTPPTESDFEPYYALITQDDLVLRMNADPFSEILGTVNAGEKLHVLQITTVDGIEWAATDRGWINAEYVQTPADLLDTPTDDDSCATVIVSVSIIHPTADPDSMSVGQLSSGERVSVSEVTHYGDIVMVRVPNGWVLATDLLFDGCTHAGTISATVTVDSMNVRSGPSVEYSVIGKAVSGESVTIKGFRNSEVNGKPWAVTPDGRWLFVEYLAFDHGILFVPGNSSGQPDSNDSTVTQPNTPTQPNAPQQTVTNTALVGMWSNSDNFKDAAAVGLTYIWVFYNDGKFLQENIICYLEYGEFHMSPSPSGKTGTYTYDGKVLTIHYETEFDPDPNGPVYVNYTETYQTSSSADTITVNEQLWTKLDTYNASKPLVNYLRKQRPGQATEPLFNNWVNQKGAKLTISNNGTFEAVTENGQSYGGSYYVYGENIYFVIDNKLCDDSGTNYIHSSPFSLNDTNLSLGSDIYTPVTE